MKLYPLSSPGLPEKIAGFCKRHQLDTLVTQSPDGFEGLVILGDGTPDDLIVSTIAHHLNGQNVVAIMKPLGKTGTSVFELLPVYLRHNARLVNILFILDQEGINIDSILQRLEKQLRKQRAIHPPRTTENEGRLTHYTCSLGERHFNVILVLNGLDEIPTKKHMIEDHLLCLANELGLARLPNRIPNAKRRWNNSITEGRKEEIFSRMVEDSTLAKRFFPQQVAGLVLLH
jgi:hypothetical protein